MEPCGPLGPVTSVRAVGERHELRVDFGGHVAEAGDVPHQAVARVLDAPGGAIHVQDPDGVHDSLVERVGGKDAGDLGGLVGRKVRQAQRMQLGA